MGKVKIIIIAAVSLDGVIGIGDEIPWRIPEDFKHFRETTMGNILIVGRTTYLTLPPKALEGRRYVVLNGGEHIEDLNFRNYQFSSLDTINYLLDGELNNFDKVYVIGGASVYDQMIDYCDEAIITWVNKTYPNGDKKFPIDKLFTNFEEVNTTPYLTSKTGIKYKIVNYKKYYERIADNNHRKSSYGENNNDDFVGTISQREGI